MDQIDSDDITDLESQLFVQIHHQEKEKEPVIISIDSSDESQDDDVILIPELPPPTITLGESDDDGNNLEVYESESDIAESAYSKGGRKTTTVVLAASSSSEEVDNIENTPINQKSKRTNANFNVHDGNSSKSECENEDACGTASTGLPYIKRGEAIPMENCIRKRQSQSITLSRISPKSKTSSGHMSDTELIETLNNLAHGLDEKKKLAGTINVQQNEDVSTDEGGKKCDSDVASVVSMKIANSEEGIPDDAISGLDKIFKFIDNNLADETMSSHSNSSYDVDIISVPVAEKPVENVSENGPKYHTVYSNEHFHNSGFDWNEYSKDHFHNSGLGWNEEMDKFYNSSWKGEHFNLAAIQRGMDCDKKLWRISAEDRFSNLLPNSHLKCYNCCDFGHESAECQRPKKPPVCYMCGETGHFKESCPNTICLRCGNETAAFIKSCESCSFQDRLICPICKVRGHSINLCPDKWRRYHSTTTMNCYPNSSTKPNSRKICCVCGKMGHYPETCRTRLTDYPIIVSKAKSHEKSYCDLARLDRRKGIPFNLLYNPKDSVHFPLAKNKPTDCYGRFLNAVGMQRVLKRKWLHKSMNKSQRPLKRSKNTSKSKELVSSNTVNIASEQVQDSTETNNMNCTVASSGKNATVEDIVEVNCLSPLSTKSTDEGNLDPSTSTNERATSLLNSACEVKIYLTDFHSSYLLSPKGQEFLRELSLQNNIKARLDSTSVGHVLLLIGFLNDQDEFYNQLLVKYRELSDN